MAIPVRAQDAAQPAPPKPAKLKISGYGLLGNLRLRQMLRILQEGKTPPTLYDANFVEDAALLLVSRLNDDGFLRPVITARLTLDDGTEAIHIWDEPVEEPMQRPIAARAVQFEIDPGVFYYFEDLKFSGLDAVPEKTARAYFVETGGLLSLKRNRLYSPERLKRSIGNLTDQLHRLGYQNASVVTTNIDSNPQTGATRATVVVQQGPQFIVRSVFQELYIDTNAEPAESRTVYPGEPFSKIWEQDHGQSLRTNYFQMGYPDTTVTIETAGQSTQTNQVQLDMKAVVHTGPRVRVGTVSFSGNVRTRDAVLERRLPLDDGDWLNRIRAERGRYRLSRLGVFDSVELKYDAVDEHTRNITYVLDEGKQIDVSLLFGFGSYELLRGGVQVDQFNVFGRAHHQRLKVVQSFRSSSADYLYTMPEFFGENMDVFITGEGLRREEVSFTRLEYGGGAGLRKYFRGIHTDISTRYNYEILQAQDVDPDIELLGVQNSRAAAIITDLNHDRRDNPLYPRRGYKLFANLEVASDYLGGDVDYQRMEMSGAWHRAISDSQWVHLGISHGLVAAISSTAEDLPFNRRFFPGGENSVRGYTEGEAAPRNERGEVVGAETYLLGNFEFEQGLTPTWSVVVFADAVTFGRDLSAYPGDETLVSVGLGLRWKTFIGPVRVEYGHNLNPRSEDPSGAVHFSLGFPF
ncbi:MAG TPA: BamA/TamA family outer membrane protein [Verrucomicrobiae bacterium]|nr:BamA/TamA family outer membrane protein [Verrucomicrobiae bacterium]